jgi:hypothetical protein
MLTNYFPEIKYDQAMATPLVFKSVLSRGRVVQSTKIGGVQNLMVTSREEKGIINGKMRIINLSPTV